MSLIDTFAQPPRAYSLVPFWFLNDDLDEQELRRQIDDFAAHGVYGFVPHARLGLPKSIGFMSGRWLKCIRACVEHAAAREMVVFLYDEGMYPSGSCAGQVVAEDPRYATRCLQQRERGSLNADEYLVAEDDQFIYVNRRSNGRIRGVHYGTDDGQGGAPASADLLNPESVATFLRLVHDRYHAAMPEHFGKTVQAIFTDEPSVLGRGHLPGVVPWTWGFEAFLDDHFDYDFRPRLAALFDKDHPEHEPIRSDWDRAVNARLEETYYAQYNVWCEQHGVALTGHPAGPGDMGVLRYFQIPGQDVVWRYIEPFQPSALEGAQSTQAKCSSSAQRHFGRTRNANECFGAYGWEFTEEEMWWLTNWLLVRGVNCLIPHAFYYSLRGDRRDERPPDVGPNSAWWPRYAAYADYCRRLCWLLAEGKQVCSIAVLGSATEQPWPAARVLYETQHDFNYLDADTLKRDCVVDENAIRVGDMAYCALIVDGPGWMDDELTTKLAPLLKAGRVIVYGESLPNVAAPAAPDGGSLVTALDALVPVDVRVTPANSHVRVIHMRHETTDLYVFANEGPEPVKAAIEVAAAGCHDWWDPETGAAIDSVASDCLSLPPGRIRVLSCAVRG